MSGRKEWSGFYYEDGELKRAEVIKDGPYTNLWVSDDIRDDIQSWEDLDGLFFDDQQHFIGWAVSKGDEPALTPEEIWDFVSE